MAHIIILDVIRKFTRDIAGAIIGQQTWFMNDISLIAARGDKRHIERISDVRRFHCCAEFPAYNITRDVI
jgi:hypothetical protein